MKKKIISLIIYVIYLIFYFAEWWGVGQRLGDKIQDTILDSVQIDPDSLKGTVDIYTFSTHRLGEFAATNISELAFLTIILVILTVVLYHINFVGYRINQAENFMATHLANEFMDTIEKATDKTNP